MARLVPTHLMRQLKIDQPIIQAPMLGPGTPALAAAVSNAGGLGSLAVSSLSPLEIQAAVSAMRRQTSCVFNVNVFVLEVPHPTDQELQTALMLLHPFREELGLAAAQLPARYGENFYEQLEMLIQLKLPVVSFTFGLLDSTFIERLHQAGSIVIGTATSVAEAQAWENEGADIICVQGAEAGGHRGTFLGTVEASMTGTLALVPQIVDNLKLPVIAAGGIMDGRGIAAALMLGAGAVQMGTAFLPCIESSAHPAWKMKIREATDTSTGLTRSFSGRAARGIINDFMRRMKSCEHMIPHYPVQNILTAEIRQVASQSNRPEFMSLWAGQAAGLAQIRKMDISATELMRQLVSELTHLI